LAALLAAATGVALLLMAEPEPRGAVPEPAAPAAVNEAPERASPFGSTAPVLGPDAPPAAMAQAPPTTAATATLPSLSYEELRQLQEQFAQSPDPDGQFGRVAAAMIFADAVQRLQQLNRDGGDAAEMRALARLIAAGLPRQVQDGQLTAAQAAALRAWLATAQQPEPGAASANRGESTVPPQR
jgi:hypothetical protein